MKISKEQKKLLSEYIKDIRIAVKNNAIEDIEIAGNNIKLLAQEILGVN